jgi:hypothetical protein
MPTNTYVALATQTLSSAAASVTFSSIPQGYTDLVLVAQPAISSGNDNMRIRVGNGSVDTGSNYSYTALTGNGSTATSARAANETSILTDYNGYMQTTLGNNTKIINFQNYSNTTTFKTVLTRSNNAPTGTDAMVSLWRSTAAINTMTLFISGGAANFAVGSTFTIYGIKAVQVYTPSTIPASLNIGDQIYVPYTGSATTLSIPAGVNTCQLEVFGAAGGTAQGSTANGKGGYARGVYTLGGGATTVYAYVGGQGASRTASTGSGTLAGGFNGGGNGFWAGNTTNQGYASSGGGGGTDFRIGGTALANRVIVAGGGGGEGGGTGGNGQFSTGGNGEPVSAGQPFSAQGGFGGTQSAGGAGGGASSAGSSSAGNPGSLGIGGDGGPNRTYGQGGGGGGGYYGGGGGGTCGNGSGAGGGGGSSFVGSLASSATLNGVNNGNGYAIFTRVS